VADERRVATMPRPELWAWTFVGLAAALTIVVVVVAPLNEILLPLTFAAVLAVVFKPAVTALTRWRVRPSVFTCVVEPGSP
jgi:predicted PurR-regulated permease PerM